MSIYQPYKSSTITIEGATPHPTALAESTTMAAIKAPAPTVYPLLPQRVIDEQLASHEQLEALINVCQAHSEYLDTKWIIGEDKTIRVCPPDQTGGVKHRRGALIGDGTGCGKGVITALIILTNWCEGRKKAVWLTKNEPLLEDCRRDWQRLGGDPAQIVPLSKYKQGETINITEGILFCTYGGIVAAAKGNKKSRVDQIVDWLGTDFDGCVNLDESHLLGNCIGEDGERGRTKASARGLAGTDLVNALPHARVTYLSATAAAKASSLSYCQRLGLWSTKAFPFESKQAFVNSIEASGTAALEMVAQDLKRLGLYMARTLSFDGVKFETMVHDLTPDQILIWDTYAEAFIHIHNQMDVALQATNLQSGRKCTNARAKAALVSIFEGMKQRFFNALLCAAKAPTLIAAIEQDLEAGHACVVQIVSTNEALLERKLAEIPSSQWGDVRSIDFTPREGILGYLMSSFPTSLYRTYINENGEERSELIQDSSGNAVKSQEAIAIRDTLIEKISLLPPVTGLLDQLNWHFGHEKVAEITGRSKRIILKDNRYQLVTRSSSHNIAETTDFQGDKKQILVFTKSGGTGRSYHSDLTCKNQRLRRHYLVECGWEAIGAVQGFGRSHRSAQRQPPEVILLSTNVKGEVRFLSTIAKRLGSLGAATKGQRNTGNSGGIFNEDTNNFSTIYANMALIEFYNELYKYGIEGISISEFCNCTGLKLLAQQGGLKDDLPKMNTFLNRLLALPIDTQNALFGDFEARIERRVNQAKRNGTYDRGVETIHADGGFNEIEVKLLQSYESGAETICTTLERLQSPMVITRSEAEQRVGESAFDYYRHSKTGVVAIAMPYDSRTDRMTGKVIQILKIYHPVSIGKEFETMTLPDFQKAWQLAKPDDLFWWSWKTAIDRAPQYVKEQMYIVTGLLLPVWDQIPGNNTRVVRIETNQGNVLLGRLVRPEYAKDLYDKFGLGSSIKLSSTDIYQKIWESGETLPVGKWKLTKSYLRGDQRLEILEVYDHDKLALLKRIGCFTEMVSFRTRVFIPLDRAEEIIAKLMELI